MAKARPKPINGSAEPSSNWEALKQTMVAQKNHRRTKNTGSKRSPSKPSPSSNQLSRSIPSTSSSIVSNMMKTFRGSTDHNGINKIKGPERGPNDINSSNSRSLNHPHVDKVDDGIEGLRSMVLGQVSYTPEKSLTGKYLAVDCEMVGVGPEGSESSLARVSMVNFYGAVLLDTFVKQREEVTDYRTAFSGVRHEDVYGPNAKTFQEVQKIVADFLTPDRILVGHAVHHDLKTLMLSHPSSQTRDTQTNPEIRKKYKSGRISLKKAIKGELGIDVQTGEHNSVTDARASMALYRLHKDTWEPLFRHRPSQAKGKQKSAENSAIDTTVALQQPTLQLSTNATHSDQTKAAAVPTSPPTKSKMQRTADIKQKAKARSEIDTSKKSRKTKISSGLSVVVKRKNGTRDVLSRSMTKVEKQRGAVGNGAASGVKWWATLDNAGSSSKGSLRI